MGKFRDFQSIDFNASLIRIDLFEDQFDKGRFAGPAGADQKNKVAFIDANVDIFNSDIVAICFGHVFKSYHIRATLASDFCSV